MATKRKSKTTKKKTAPKKDPVKSAKIEHLETLIFYSEKAMGTSEDLDTLFTNQVNRLRKEIAELK